MIKYGPLFLLAGRSLRWPSPRPNCIYSLFMITEPLSAPPSLRWCLSCRHPVESPDRVFCAQCGSLLPDPPALDGRYQIDQSLGEGGFGHTYLAHDIRTRKPVAVKRVPRLSKPSDRAMLTP